MKTKDNITTPLNDNQRHVIAAYLWIRKNNMSIPDHILDTMKTAAIKSFQTAITERETPNIQRLHESTVSDIRGALGVEPDDTSKDDRINHMDNDKLFDKWCEWQGLVNWSGRIRGKIKEIYEVELPEM